ncbi:LOW QUALITY PROTEIN: regulator of G-protein signaling protein-like [Passerculus sandwichensis]
MRHLCAFLRGTAGEELMDFWLITERLLGLDESDGSQRELFLSLEHRLRATHLREGSSVLTFCTTIVGSLPKAKHIQSISTRREILSKMQEQVLFMIQSYWLPKFLVHCKMGMEEEELCWPLLQEYQERLSQAGWQPPGLAEPLPTMHIKRSQGVPGPYCSQRAKAEVWAMVKEGRDSQELKMATFQVKAEKQPGPAGSREELWLDKNAVGSTPQQSQHPAFGGRGRAAFPGRPQSSAKQDLQNLCKVKMLPDLLPSASLVRLPSLKKPIKTLDFLPWALSAEACAGRPFRDFLQHQNRPMETLLLDLWHDLEEFLPVVLDSSRENSFSLRHLIGEKICKTYLEDSSIEKLPLETRTLVSLWNRLTYGEFSPWIFRAQKEICKVLCGLYEEFLAADDRTFLQFMAPGMDLPMAKVPGHAAGRWGHFHLSQRMNQALQLSQALHGTRSLEGVSSKHWQLLAARDLQKGGSIQAEMELLLGSHESQRMIADEQAVSSPSREEELLQLMKAALAVASDRIARENAAAAARKREARKRRLEEEGEEYDEDEEDEDEDEEEKEGPYYQKKKKLRVFARQGREEVLGDKGCHINGAWAWDAIRELVRSFCKFRRDMKNQTRCAEFQDFLRQERRNKRENLPVKEKKSKSPAKSPAQSPRKGKGKGKGQQQQVTLIKRRILDKQIIVVNFLVDDLRFYLEMDRFSKLADGMEDAEPQNTESGNYSSFLKKKLEIISKLFLNSEIPPKLRVNISQKERDFIWRSSSKGPLTRAIYHNAKVTLFPILMFFWRRYPSIPSLPRGRRLWACHRISSHFFLCHQGAENADKNLPGSSAGIVSLELHCPRCFSHRFCTWKVMRTFQAYQELSRFGTPEEEEEENSELPAEGDRSSQEQERSSQEPKGGRSSKVQQEKGSQEPKGGRSSRGRKEGKVPASSPAKSPSKAAKSPGPKKLEAIASTTQHAPGKKALLSYNMSDGLGLLLPRPPKKTEPPEEQKAADASGEKRPSLTEPALQAGP